MEKDNEIVVHLDHVSKQFGGIYALSEVDFELRKEIHSIVGHNGAGKSTLVKILIGALQNRRRFYRPEMHRITGSQWSGRSWLIFRTLRLQRI